MAEIMLPLGPDKGSVPVTQAEERTLRYFAEKGKRADLKNAAQAELARRAAGGKPAAAPPSPAAQSQSQAIEKAAASTATMSLEKLTHDPSAVTARLTEYAQNFHLVSPATHVDALPPGCGVAVTFVKVDPSTAPDGPKEVYDVSGRLGLSGDTLAKIWAAAGGDWDPRQCGRLDNGSDPHYVHYQAVGYVRNFDGSIRTVTGEVEIDAREGSPQIEEIRTKAAKPDRNGKSRDPANQILELRKFILRHAERKAKNRAIADMGVKRSYAPVELTKPFAVARLMWTGESDDPELRRQFALMHAERMIDGNAALYGARQLPQPPPIAPQVTPIPQQFTGHAPPQLGASAYDNDEDFPPDYDTTGEEKPASQPKAAAPPVDAQGESKQQTMKM